MKEIDFIPEWYRTGRRRRVSYHRQYTMISCLFIALVAWSYSAGGFLTAAKGSVEGTRSLLEASEPFAREYAALKEEIRVLEETAQVLERIRVRTPLDAILAELSYLISERVILSRLEIVSEPLRQETGKGREAVVLAKRPEGDDAVLPAADTHTKLIMVGIAADAGDAAALIAALEQSNFFSRIIPGYSRSKDVRGHRATEFQITAHVADYVLASEARVR